MRCAKCTKRVAGTFASLRERPGAESRRPWYTARKNPAARLGCEVEAPGIEFRSLGARWALREPISGHRGRSRWPTRAHREPTMPTSSGRDSLHPCRASVRAHAHACGLHRTRSTDVRLRCPLRRLATYQIIASLASSRDGIRPAATACQRDRQRALEVRPDVRGVVAYLAQSCTGRAPRTRRSSCRGEPSRGGTVRRVYACVGRLEHADPVLGASRGAKHPPQHEAIRGIEVLEGRIGPRGTSQHRFPKGPRRSGEDT